jgi:hypothetical protein
VGVSVGFQKLLGSQFFDLIGGFIEKVGKAIPFALLDGFSRRNLPPDFGQLTKPVNEVFFGHRLISL